MLPTMIEKPSSPKYARRNELAALASAAGFAVSPRTLENWPELTPAYYANGRAFFSVDAFFEAVNGRVKVEPVARPAIRRRLRAG